MVQYMHKSNNGCVYMGIVKFTEDEFKSKISEMYGEYYSTEYDTFEGVSKGFKFKCKDHGYFNMAPHLLLSRSQKCSDCAKSDTLDRNKKTHTENIKKIFGGRYVIKDWLNFSRMKHEVIVSCEIHGDFVSQFSTCKTSPYGNCKECHIDEHYRSFLVKANKKHKGAYTYSREDYSSSRELMKISCNKHEKYFNQRPSAHLQGQGCPICGEEDRIDVNTKTTEQVIEEFKNIHGDLYDYSDTVYEGAHIKLNVRCIKHGVFGITSNNHKASSGCPECSKDDLYSERATDFHRKLIDKYGTSTFDTSQVEYNGSTSPIKLRCIEHDVWFTRTPNKLLGTTKNIGCSMCHKASQGRWSISGVIKIPNVREDVGYFYWGSISGLRGIKIGVTKDLKSREGCYRRDLSEYKDHSFSYSGEVESTYLESFITEVIVKKIFKGYEVKHDIEFGGKNEVYDPPKSLLTVLNDISSGRYSKDIRELSTVVSSNNSPELLQLVDKIKENYK